MMELSVWEQGEQIGTVTAQKEGLFYIFICKISKHAEQLRRIYVISKWRVEYLGIRIRAVRARSCRPATRCRIFLDGLTAAARLPCRAARGSRGAARRTAFHPQRPAQAAGGRLCACPAARRGAALPQWLARRRSRSLWGRARLVFRLDAAGCMPSIEMTENGGSTDEAQNFSNPSAGGVPSDAAPRRRRWPCRRRRPRSKGGQADRP